VPSQSSGMIEIERREREGWMNLTLSKGSSKVDRSIRVDSVQQTWGQSWPGHIYIYIYIYTVIRLPLIDDDGPIHGHVEMYWAHVLCVSRGRKGGADAKNQEGDEEGMRPSGKLKGSPLVACRHPREPRLLSRSAS
jgi:hypothetical protein